MLTLRSIVFSSQNILLSASLLVGVFAILVSMFAITSGRWIHVFRSFPVEAEVVSARVDPFSSKLQQVEAETQRNVSKEDHDEAEEEAGDLHFTVDCQEEKGNQHAVRSRHQCGTSSAGDRGRRYCADEAYGGLWRVCLLYHCLNGSAPTSTATATVCRHCSTATAAVAAGAAAGAANVDPASIADDSRRPSSSLQCHVTTVVIAISAEAHKTLFVYILSSALLVCGVSLEMAGTCCRSFCLILGAFFHTTAGLLQFLGMFLFATVVSDEMKPSSAAADVGDSHVTQTGYNYDWGSILAVIAFAATNLAAILAAYSYRGRHQLDQKDEKASFSLIVASVDLDKAYEHS